MLTETRNPAADLVIFPTCWDDAIPRAQREIYEQVVSESHARGLQFALGGAFAAAAYLGRWQDTGGMDLFAVPEDRGEFVEVLTVCGLRDDFDHAPYDRRWIYRGRSDGVVVDLTWAIANGRATVDREWLGAGPQIEFCGPTVRIVPPEELIWSKLYVLQRDRCEWPDVLNLINAAGPRLDWQHLLKRMGEDAPLLYGALSIFRWLCPERARQLPQWLWAGMARSLRNEETGPGHAELLDARPWLVGPVSGIAA